MSDKAVEGLQGASTALKEWHRPHIFDFQKEEEKERAALDLPKTPVPLEPAPPERAEEDDVAIRLSMPKAARRASIWPTMPI